MCPCASLVARRHQQLFIIINYQGLEFAHLYSGARVLGSAFKFKTGILYVRWHSCLSSDLIRSPHEHTCLRHHEWPPHMVYLRSQDSPTFFTANKSLCIKARSLRVSKPVNSDYMFIQWLVLVLSQIKFARQQFKFQRLRRCQRQCQRWSQTGEIGYLNGVLVIRFAVFNF